MLQNSSAVVSNITAQQEGLGFKSTAQVGPFVVEINGIVVSKKCIWCDRTSSFQWTVCLPTRDISGWSYQIFPDASGCYSRTLHRRLDSMGWVPAQDRHRSGHTPDVMRFFQACVLFHWKTPVSLWDFDSSFTLTGITGDTSNLTQKLRLTLFKVHGANITAVLEMIQKTQHLYDTTLQYTKTTLTLTIAQNNDSAEINSPVCAHSYKGLGNLIGGPAAWNPLGIWSKCLLDLWILAYFWRFPGHFKMIRDPGADSHHAGQISLSIWPGLPQIGLNLDGQGRGEKGLEYFSKSATVPTRTYLNGFKWK